eukprot:gene25721-biopygen19516
MASFVAFDRARVRRTRGSPGFIMAKPSTGRVQGAHPSPLGIGQGEDVISHIFTYDRFLIKGPVPEGAPGSPLLGCTHFTSCGEARR